MKKTHAFSIAATITITFLVYSLFSCTRSSSHTIRQQIPLNTGWKTAASDSNLQVFDGFEEVRFDDSQWKTVDVPHNWDDYHGYLRKLHGNRHGTAWYRKSFTVEKASGDKRYFLFFEGVGSYATVWLNGKKAGYHAGGRTTFTIDITEAVVFDRPNILAVRADHPANIRDLPWVCGGCSDEWGFSEGSQPMGIFRPVTLIITSDVRIESFGIHVWNDTSISDKKATLHVGTEIKNYSAETRRVVLKTTLLSKSGKKLAESVAECEMAPGTSRVIKETQLYVRDPKLWSPDLPYLYTLRSEILENEEIIDAVETIYGIRRISWPVMRADSTGQFLINGKPYFINGIGEYEHMFGSSHAFTDEQIKVRAAQIIAAGFNAFRDAHQPHNLRYQEYWDKEGILWWPQMSAHIWFDNPAFRENFKILLRDWIKERRNNPSNIMWGLQNESILPEDFAEECVDIIRELDPTSSSQRLITTCNGGTGTDWNVVQNWSGTYGGNPENYGNELKQQGLNGEYGAWRSIDLHTEGPFNQQGVLSEDRMTQLLEMKVRLAGSVKDQCCGQFLWLLSSHDNPGRIQSGEGLRDIDRIGPVNYKGLFTSWGEPLDAFYMFRANYVSKENEPMVYIVSHTWPNRWLTPGMKDSIIVYSNCDEVELYNDVRDISLGKRKNRGIGLSFLWEKVNIRYNVLFAAGFVKGKEVATDVVILNHLPESPGYSKLIKTSQSLTKSKQGYHYLYRVNCGGPDYTDENGNTWMVDRHQGSDTTWGSRSWTDSFAGVSPFYGSQRRTFDAIDGTKDGKLFQTFRYGLGQLSFNFPVPDGEYLVELYFCEPWYGTGGSMNCKGWRLFDIAVNDTVVLKDFDIWSEAGHDRAIKKDFTVTVKGGMLRVHFPTILSGQAIISAIAIAGKNSTIQPAQPSPLNITSLKVSNPQHKHLWKVETWLDIGDKSFMGSNIRFFELPSLLYGTEWIQTPSTIEDADDIPASFTVRQNSDVFIALHPRLVKIPGWMEDYDRTLLMLKTDDGFVYPIYSRRYGHGETVNLGNINIRDRDNMHYSVFVVPVSSLAAPADQRPVRKYSSELAIVKGITGKKRMLNDRHIIAFINDATEEISWPFYVGLAGVYGIHFNFQNNTGKTLPAEMTVETPDGIVLHREVLRLENRGERWQTVKTSTGTSINAGSYRVRLRISGAKGLLLQELEIR
ncbi:MAG: DUF4982 domain-containing protein [Bacteroidales bacterium]|nr:DUF4982 domain-containing protein [Bacteroidales bacterium]